MIVDLDSDSANDDLIPKNTTTKQNFLKKIKTSPELQPSGSSLYSCSSAAAFYTNCIAFT